jgi:hypothetical protein
MRRILLSLVAAGVCLGAAAWAQEPVTSNVPPAPNIGVRGHVEGLIIPAIPDAPFSARLVVELSGEWADGATVRSSFFNVVARDSQGRVHQEMRRLVPAGSGRESTLMSVTIMDAPKRERIACSVEQKICRVTMFFPQVKLFDEPEGLSRDGKSYLTREKKGTEMLGDQQVERTLETRTVNVGAEGNDKPLVSTREFWYSPSLKINLALKRVCACGSIQDLRVTDLQLTEPDATLFTPPAGYTMIDLRPARIQQRQ